MPVTSCLEPGCPEFASVRGRCEQHSRSRNREIARSGSSVYGTARWRALRRTVLRRANRMCAQCARWATDVDHIVPLDRGGDPWELSNLQALCRSCHSSKTAKETWHDGPRAHPGS